MRDQPMRRPYARLPILIFAITAVALLIAAGTLYAIERRLVAISGETLALAAADIADKLDLVLYERASDTQAMAKAGAKLHQDHAGLSGYLASIQQAYPIYLWLASPILARWGKTRTGKAGFSSTARHEYSRSRSTCWSRRTQAAEVNA